MDALQYICMDIGARISSDIDKLIIPICKWGNAEGYLILPYFSSKINCCSSLWLAVKRFNEMVNEIILENFK
jgi:hypothetical protein